MRHFSITLLSKTLVVALSMIIACEAQAARKVRNNADTVPGCDTIRELGQDIYKNSKPHRACAAHSCPIDYFERSPSLLVNTRGTPRVGSARLLDSAGNYLTSCVQRACDDCSMRFRYVCVTPSTNTIAKRAKAKTGNYTVYYKARKSCVRIPDVGRCKGSVKGLCNQVLH